MVQLSSDCEAEAAQARAELAAWKAQQPRQADIAAHLQQFVAQAECLTQNPAETQAARQTLQRLMPEPVNKPLQTAGRLLGLVALFGILWCLLGRWLPFGCAADWAHSYQTHRGVFANVEHVFANDWSLKAGINQTRRKYDDVMGYLYAGWPDWPKQDGSDFLLIANKWNAEYVQTSQDLKLNGSFELRGRAQDLVVGYNQSSTSYDAPWYAYYGTPRQFKLDLSVKF